MTWRIVRPVRLDPPKASSPALVDKRGFEVLPPGGGLRLTRAIMRALNDKLSRAEREELQRFRKANTGFHPDLVAADAVKNEANARAAYFRKQAKRTKRAQDKALDLAAAHALEGLVRWLERPR